MLPVTTECGGRRKRSRRAEAADGSRETNVREAVTTGDGAQADATCKDAADVELGRVEMSRSVTSRCVISARQSTRRTLSTIAVTYSKAFSRSSLERFSFQPSTFPFIRMSDAFFISRSLIYFALCVSSALSPCLFLQLSALCTLYSAHCELGFVRPGNYTLFGYAQNRKKETLFTEIINPTINKPTTEVRRVCQLYGVSMMPSNAWMA